MDDHLDDAASWVDRYLDRIGVDRPNETNIEALTTLMQAHLSTVPFENLDVFARRGVHTDLEHSLSKIVDRRRGGWCFELNGAFAWLLTQLGFPVKRLGAAVLLDGPSDMVDHLTLEVTLEQPYLVDVGFGESFLQPLVLNMTGPQSGGNDAFEFIPSPKGTTLLRHTDVGPEPQYRFKRVTLQLSDFDPASKYLQETDGLQWTEKPFATRLVDGGPERLTLLRDRLKRDNGSEVSETPVSESEWPQILKEHFGMTP